MSARYPVKWYHQGMQGAGDMGDTSAGALVAMLKRVLVNGFGLLPLDSLVYDSETGEVTGTISAGHAYPKDVVLLIEGADQEAYNGEQRLTWVNSTQFRYVPATVPATTAATGTLQAKVAPLGWEILAEDPTGEIVIFGSTDPEAYNVKLRVDNSAFSGWTNTTYYHHMAAVAMVEDVVDINTYTEISAHHWPATQRYRSNKLWELVGDSRIFYWFMNYANVSDVMAGFCFGDINSVRPGDRYGAVLGHYGSLTGYGKSWNSTANTVSSTTSGGATKTDLLNHNSTSDRIIARPYHQIFGAVSWSTHGLFDRFGQGLPMPNPADNGYYLGIDPTMVMEPNTVLRGYLPGVLCPYHTHSAHKSKNFDGLPSLPNRIVRFIEGNYSTGNAAAATAVAFDLTGPWR